jgi:hypothetical protein
MNKMTADGKPSDRTPCLLIDLLQILLILQILFIQIQRYQTLLETKK